jgi:hypothetical protein
MLHVLHELTLRGLVLANPIVPFFVIKQKGLSLTDSLLIVLCIIPIEMLVIWLVFKFDRIAINFYRLLIAVLLANIATSIIGIPFLYNYYIEINSNNPQFLVLFLTGNFLIAWLVESLIYISFLKQENLSLVNIVKAAFASNLVSYLMFAFVLLPSTNNFYRATSISSQSQMVQIFSTYSHFQEGYYYENNHFASKDEFYKISYEKRINKLLDGDRYFQYEIQSSNNAMNTSLTATSKREDIPSARVTISRFSYNGKDSITINTICLTDPPSMIPPEIPKLVNGGLQCPSGSRELYSKPK